MWIMTVARKCIGAMKKIKHKVMFKIKLWELDSMWEYMGGSCWGLFSPSFYYTHTEEEIERISKQMIESCEKMIDEYRNNGGKKYL